MNRCKLTKLNRLWERREGVLISNFKSPWIHWSFNSMVFMLHFASSSIWILDSLVRQVVLHWIWTLWNPNQRSGSWTWLGWILWPSVSYLSLLSSWDRSVPMLVDVFVMVGVVIVVVVFPLLLWWLFCDLFGDFDVACIFAFVTIVIEQEVDENCTHFVRYLETCWQIESLKLRYC